MWVIFLLGENQNYGFKFIQDFLRKPSDYCSHCESYKVVKNGCRGKQSYLCLEKRSSISRKSSASRLQRRSQSLRCKDVAQADFYREVMDILSASGIEVRIWTLPQEVAPIPFNQNRKHAAYEPDDLPDLLGWGNFHDLDRLRRFICWIVRSHFPKTQVASLLAWLKSGLDMLYLSSHSNLFLLSQQLQGVLKLLLPKSCHYKQSNALDTNNTNSQLAKLEFIDFRF